MNSEPATRLPYLRIRFSLISVAIGIFIFIAGAKPNWFGWERAPVVVGFVQIAVFLFGLALICLGGYVGLSALWGKEQRTIIADIGLRLVGTGYVISVFTGLADVFGMGSQPLPNNPYFGPWQAGGVLIGQIVIAVGFLMLIPYHFHLHKNSES
jgi:hypothetical protein